MPSWSRCVSCLGLMMLAIMTRESSAKAHDKQAIYKVHALVKKSQITAPVYLKRAEPTCQPSYALCDNSLGGDCCPDGYSCGSISCSLTTDGPSTACGITGFFDCPFSIAPDKCCPSGFGCPTDDGDCIPPAGVTYTCPDSYSACAASLGYGCCPNGMACGEASCYHTTPSTRSVTSEITTTDSKGDPTTIVTTWTTTMTPGAGTSGSDQGTTPLFPAQLGMESSVVPKVPAQGGDGGGNGMGISRGALGGIVAGIVVVLIVIIAAAFFIIRRLKRTEKAAEAAASSKRDNSSGHHRSAKSGHQSVSEIDGYDGRSSSAYGNNRPGRNRNRTVSDSTASMLDSRASPGTAMSFPHRSEGSTPPAWPGQYNPVPLSEADSRPQSIDSSRENSYNHQHRNSQQSQATTKYRFSQDSTMTNSQNRHLSIASELDGAHGTSELDTGDETPVIMNTNLNELEKARRRSSNNVSFFTQHVRRTSDPSSTSPAASPSPQPTPPGQPQPHQQQPLGSPLSVTSPSATSPAPAVQRGRTESSAALHALSTVTEISEGTNATNPRASTNPPLPNIPGFFGPANLAAGQTDALIPPTPTSSDGGTFSAVEGQGHNTTLPPPPQRQSSVMNTPTEAYSGRKGRS